MSRLTSKVYLIIFSFIIVAAGLYGLAYVGAAATPPAKVKPGSTLEQRVAQRKKERSIKLDEDSKERIQSRCTSAQSTLRTQTDGYTSSATNRDKTYRSIDAKLWIVIGNLKFIEKDTFKLEQQRLEYLKRVQAFENQSAQFQQAIKDLAGMNCQADPTGFQAVLETARLYNSQIRSSFIGIKSYLIDHVQPSIADQSNALKLKTSTE